MQACLAISNTTNILADSRQRLDKQKNEFYYKKPLKCNFTSLGIKQLPFLAYKNQMKHIIWISIFLLTIDGARSASSNVSYYFPSRNWRTADSSFSFFFLINTAFYFFPSRCYLHSFTDFIRQ